jgi:hypothetical protein
VVLKWTKWRTCFFLKVEASTQEWRWPFCIPLVGTCSVNAVLLFLCIAKELRFYLAYFIVVVITVIAVIGRNQNLLVIQEGQHSESPGECRIHLSFRGNNLMSCFSATISSTSSAPHLERPHTHQRCCSASDWGTGTSP